MIGKNIIKIFVLIAFIILAVSSQEAGEDTNLRNLVTLCGKGFPKCPKGSCNMALGICQS